ncbi:uncharacterized protein LOC144458693 [Epinephelus lanceolatus]
MVKIDYLFLLGSKTPAESVQRIMRKIGTNALWANYSMKGLKGKKNFQDLPICPVIIKACRRNHPKVIQKTIEASIADTLRYAPHRGTKTDRETSMTQDSTTLGQEDEAAPEEHITTPESPGSEQ